MLTGGQSPRRRLAAPAFLLALALAVGLAACGSSASGPPSQLAPNNLVNNSELSKYPESSLDRTFLEYWSNLQFHSWADVASYYEPDFRDFVGTEALINAKKAGSSVYPFLKPDIVRSSSRNGLTTVYYTLTMEDGTKELASSTWRKVGGNWQIVFDSRLDGELTQQAQEQVQLEEGGGEAVDPSLPLSEKAVQAGRTAAQLQARFLQQDLKTGEAP